jgi:hypothetical protein
MLQVRQTVNLILFLEITIPFKTLFTIYLKCTDKETAEDIAPKY